MQRGVVTPSGSRWALSVFSLQLAIVVGRDTVKCKSCGSDSQRKFTAEIGIHFPGLKNIDKPVVWVFPEVVICSDCGRAWFDVPETELSVLAKAG
jgi:hypothetical protein